ncbi:MAG: threonine synthase [Chitinivibrionales bacterium]|nr:threonine synthase [Chitinivibrionales bacterium]
MSTIQLQSFGSVSPERYPLDHTHFRDTSGRLLEVDNAFAPLRERQIDRLKKLFDTRAGSWVPIDRSGVWRYRELLPAFKPFDRVVTLMEGNTPVYAMPRCGSYTGMENLKVKHLGCNPTGSFKDAGMTAAITMAAMLGKKSVACASTGNTSASMAAYAARAGMRSVVFIPGGQVAYGKLSQSLDYGAVTIQIDGDFDKAMSLVETLCSDSGLYLLNSINPFRVEGQKTIMIELLHQLQWRCPDWIVVPGGNLGNVSAFGKAFEELQRLGFITKPPRLACIQAHGANPFYASFASGVRLLKAVSANTRATAIKIGNPISFEKAWHSLELTCGVVEEVSEDEIAAAKSMIGRDGIGCEPASAVTVAGCRKLAAAGVMKPGESVVCILTGHLLKDPEYTVEYHSDELFLDPHRNVSLSGTQRITAAAGGNRPVRLAADETIIRDFLESLDAEA